MNEFMFFFIILYVVATPLAALLWPNRKQVLWVWGVPAVLVYPVFWQSPGIVAVGIGMITLIIFLRALDANASFSENKPDRYAFYCHYLLPHSSECKQAESVNKRLIRFLRGCLFILISVGLLSLGKQIELWRTYPYLDDLMMAFELSFGFVGMIEIITVIFMSLRMQFFLTDSFSADFILAPSLRSFWNEWWNRPISGVLKRGIFYPSGGKRNRMQGLLLVFFACGLMHAAPLMLAGEQKILWLILALGSLGFFMCQAIALCVEHFMPRKFRKGLFARIYFYLVMLVSLPLYPAPALIAMGAHNRPAETATILRLINFVNDESMVSISFD